MGAQEEEKVKEYFSKQLQVVMKERNLQQNELADLLDVSESTVGKWILKKSLPRMGIIQKLADYFNKPKSFFLEEESNNPSELNQDFFRLLKAAQDEGYTANDVRMALDFIHKARKNDS